MGRKYNQSTKESSTVSASAPQQHTTANQRTVEALILLYLSAQEQ